MAACGRHGRAMPCSTSSWRPAWLLWVGTPHVEVDVSRIVDAPGVIHLDYRVNR
jgi:hypothetical protein